MYQQQTLGTNQGAKVLIIEDERSIANSLAYCFQKEGFKVQVAYEGRQGLDMARSWHPDIVILDLILPGLSGYDVCRILRRESSVPIIMLTAKSQEVDRVVGLEMGADDYVVKPFSSRELIARVRAVLRRVGRPSSDLEEDERPIRVGELEIDPARFLVILKGNQVVLSVKEFELLRLLAQNRGRVVRREVILDRLWPDEEFPDPRTLDVHIHRLREKLEADPSHPTLILTVRGVGYKLEG